MRRTEALQGVRMAVFLNLLHRWELAELNQEEAAELLGVSERTFRRWTRRYEEEGEAGLLDRRLGKASGKRVPVDRAEEVERLYRERYQGFTVKHFHEHLCRSRLRLGLHLDQASSSVDGGGREGAAQGGAPAQARAAAAAGDDAAPGRLAPRLARGRGAARPDRDMDDATGAIYSAFLVAEEGTASTFRALKEVFGQHGLPMSLYTDRGAHYYATIWMGRQRQSGWPFWRSRRGDDCRGATITQALFCRGMV